MGQFVTSVFSGMTVVILVWIGHRFARFTAEIRQFRIEHVWLMGAMLAVLKSLGLDHEKPPARSHKRR